ncbi:hypothetical protein IEQ34_025550 [Dendrobium chrysotoxum]|uniref:SSD domain-containing protein n=1 Tax=Dendrobium chrysotoxum TaxID=161865 RepID=A0AAV7FP03_DENCH|nr:hypothetical protein IEQ34_025550 [Dendrobium chrysotoxum]
MRAHQRSIIEPGQTDVRLGPVLRVASCPSCPAYEASVRSKAIAETGSLCDACSFRANFSLGLFGIVLVLASVSAAVGIWSALGVKVTLIIVEVLPFLLLAVGVDNIFLLAEEMDRQNALASHSNPYSQPARSTAGVLGGGDDGPFDDEEEDGDEHRAIAAAYGGAAPSRSASSDSSMYTVSAKERAARALSRVGPSIVLSASHGHCVLLQCTVFVAAMALDAKRVEAERLDCLPCLRLPAAVTLSNSNASEFSGYAALGATHGVKGEGALGRFIRRSYAPTIIRPRMGLDQRLALPKGSYLRSYFDAIDSFLDVGPPVYFVARDVDVTTRAGQQALCGRFTTCHGLSLANTLEGERLRPDVSFIAEPASSWLDDYFQWLNPALETCCRVRNNDPTLFCAPSDSEYDCQPCFANRSPHPLGGQAAYSSAITLNEAGDKVVASNIRTFHTPLRSQNDFIDALRAAERISTSVKQTNEGLVDVYAYAVYVPFFDQYLYLDRLALQLLGGALLAILVVTSALLGSVRTAAILALCVSNAVFCVAAVMALLGIGLNALTLVNLGVCAAICVEFCAHIARAFMRAPGSIPRQHALAQRERDDRTWAALVDVGPSVISGITGTKLVGISVLFWAQSDILRLYYASLWFALILIGAVHGSLVLTRLAQSLWRSGLREWRRRGRGLTSITKGKRLHRNSDRLARTPTLKKVRRSTTDRLVDNTLYDDTWHAHDR